MIEEPRPSIPTLRNGECLNSVLEVVPNAIVVVNQEGQIVLVNSQLEALFGFRRDDLLGRPVEQLFSERFPLEHTDLCSRWFASPAPRVMAEARELLGRRKDGSEFPVDIGVAPVRTTEGLFILGEIADITVRKQLEAKTLRIKEIEVQEAERRHLARELHDEIGQLLSAISVDLHTVNEAFGHVAPRLDDSISLVDQAIEHVRSLALDLRPSMLDDLGLIATLRWYTDRHAQRAGLALHLITESSGARLPADLATACYRVIQEALTNVIRHANAHQVWIEFHENQGEVRLSVRDDGMGFNPAVVQQRQAGTACFGVLGMQERVELLGGRIDIRSHPVSGTTVEVWIPQATAENRQRSIGSQRE